MPSLSRAQAGRDISVTGMIFREIELTSSAPETVSRFYADTLRLQPRTNGFRVGSCDVSFVEGTPASPYHLAFNIPANQIENAKAWSGEHLSMLSEEIYDFERWNARAIYFEDPDENVLEFIARRNLANDAEGAFAPAMILELSEFGLPVEDPPAVVDRLETGFGLQVFSGDRRTFTAVGDEHGLLIVIPVGRNWLPTDRRTAENRARLRIEASRHSETRVGADVVIRSTVPPEA
jgi:catechol-2,3-dioxygenase